MKKRYIVISTFLAVFLLIMPIVAIIAFAAAPTGAYADTFFGELDEKYGRLHSIEGEKIVVVGGSSVAFGLDSHALELYTGMPVVNFGLYAALGTKLMLDLSEPAIGEGDVVILSPELNAETLSMYFNPDTTLSALEGNMSMLFDIPFEHWDELLFATWDFVGEKIRMLSGSLASGEGIYRSEYFNEYGDFMYPRYENVMKLYYDPAVPIDLSLDAMSDEFDEFIDYLNGYIKRCEDKGATVYFSYCPMNEKGIVSTDSEAEEFFKYLEDNIKCEFISTPEDYILGAGYFFDTNFHLNLPGVQVRTLRLGYDIRIARGNTTVITDEDGNMIIEEWEPPLP